MTILPLEIVAEIANAHQGDAATALRLAEAAHEAGADAVKFQVYTSDELLVRSHPRHSHFARQSFSAAEWDEIFTSLSRKSVRVYADVFGFDALAIASRAPIAGYKIHCSDLANVPLLKAVAREGRPVILATGGSTILEIEIALHALKALFAPITLLHGYQNYPTAVEDSNLRRLSALQKQFGARAQIGYADHVAGGVPMATALPAMAIALGARLIEKHVTFDRAAKGVDWYSSLEPDEFKAFVADMRSAEAALAAPAWEFAEAERSYRYGVRKHWVTQRELSPGHVLSEADLVMKRVADRAAEPCELGSLIGRPLLRAVEKETPLSHADVKSVTWACVVARMRSARLPGKALIEIGGLPALVHLFERLRQVEGLGRFVMCTTIDQEDDPIAELAKRCGVPLHRGPVLDVLGRMLGAVEGSDVDVIMRVTGDDILIDPDYAARAIRHHLNCNAQYTDLKALPSGTEVELFDVDLLRALWLGADNRDGTEYLTTYITSHRDQFRCTSCPVEHRHARNWRLTLDTPEDLEVISALLEAMRSSGKAITYRLEDIVEFFESRPDVLLRNALVPQRATPIEVSVEVNWRKAAEVYISGRATA